MSDVDMTQDWLSVALADDEENHRVASTNRALIAIKHRTEKRFARYMQQAQTEAEGNARLSAIESEIRSMSNDVAIEYSCPEPDKLYEAAVQQAVSYLRNESAAVPETGYQQKVVDPDEIIGNTPASSSGESFKGVKNLDKAKGPASKNHPAETQNVEQRPGTREEWLNPGSADDGFGGEAPVERKMKQEDLSGTNPYKHQVGDNTKTFGDTHQQAKPVTPGSITSRWHVLET